MSLFVGTDDKWVSTFKEDNFCEVCNSKSGRGKYCSNKCYMEAYRRNPIKYYCENCGVLLKGQKRKYCSNSCRMKIYNRKLHRKEAARERQYNRNKYVKKEGDKADVSGTNNPNWKGGVTKDADYYKVYRRKERAKKRG